jgi:hypothetical protein
LADAVVDFFSPRPPFPFPDMVDLLVEMVMKVLLDV